MQQILALFCLLCHLPLGAHMARAILDQEIRSFMEQKGVPGMAVALYCEGQPFLVNYGASNLGKRTPVTENTIFEIASITKVFTATALAVEVKRGRMDLQAPVINYLPQVRSKNIPFKQVTLAQLATHTAGLPREPPPLPTGVYTPQTVMGYLHMWRPPRTIGYFYSNLGFGLIGYALAAVNGRSYEEEIQQTILRPLNMTATEINVPPHLFPLYAQGYSSLGKPIPHSRPRAWFAGGALRSTTRDLLNFLMANLGAKGPPELIQAMQFAQQGVVKVNDHLTMGLAWQRFSGGERLLIDKNGGLDGFSSYIGMVPDQRIGIVILSDKGKADVTALGRRILFRLAKVDSNP